MYKITTFKVSQNIWSEVAKEILTPSARSTWPRSRTGLQSTVAAYMRGVCLLSRSVSTNKLTIKCSITVFTPVDRDENFPTGCFLRHVTFRTLTWPPVAYCNLVPARACCYGIQQLHVVHARKHERKHEGHARKHVQSTHEPRAHPGWIGAFYFRQQESEKTKKERKKKRSVTKVSKTLMRLEKRFSVVLN